MKLSAKEIRFINEFQESGRVFFHTLDGKTVVRTMTSREVCGARVIRARQGVEAFNEEMCRLFNEKYSEPQQFSSKPLSPEDARFFELRHYRSIFPLPPEQEEEYQSLLRGDDTDLMEVLRKEAEQNGGEQ